MLAIQPALIDLTEMNEQLRAQRSVCLDQMQHSANKLLVRQPTHSFIQRVHDVPPSTDAV
jgi:hypothetical protein